MHEDRRYSWPVRLFLTYGVPALLTLAVQPTYHTPGCGCQRMKGIFWGAPRPAVVCPACQFTYFLSLSPAEAPAVIEPPARIIVDGVDIGMAVSPCSRAIAPCAHSPPDA